MNTRSNGFWRISRCVDYSKHGVTFLALTDIMCLGGRRVLMEPRLIGVFLSGVLLTCAILKALSKKVRMCCLFLDLYGIFGTYS